VVGNINGDKVENFSVLLKKRDALIIDLLDTLVEVTDRVRVLEAAMKGSALLSSVHKESGLAKRRKVDGSELEQWVVDAIKVRTTVDRAGIP